MVGQQKFQVYLIKFAFLSVIRDEYQQCKSVFSVSSL